MVTIGNPGVGCETIFSAELRSQSLDTAMAGFDFYSIELCWLVGAVAARITPQDTIGYCRRAFLIVYAAACIGVIFRNGAVYDFGFVGLVSDKHAIYYSGVAF
jgi:hypothetical protein